MPEYKVSLKAARVNANMLQKDAANALGITPKTLANWENGKTAPRATTFAKISRLYKVPIDSIFLLQKFELREQNNSVG